MLTEKLYYEDAYIKEFDASVLACEFTGNSYRIILDRTAFFPEGGGQKADSGFIGTARVTDVRETDGEIVHFSDKELCVGQKYKCKIDWDIRFSRMQNHSGEHIVSGIVHSMFGYDNVGFHMEDDCLTVDFNGELNRAQLDTVEDKANSVVFSDKKINCRFVGGDELEKLDYRSKLDLKENVRLVEIDGVDLCACCAPHVNATGEIGIVKILDFMRHRGGVRITLKCGDIALADYRGKYESVYDISVLLSAKQDDVSAAVKRLADELESVRHEFYAFKIALARNAVNSAVKVGNWSYIIGDCYDADMMREAVNIQLKNGGMYAVFSGNDTDGYSYVIGSSDCDLKKIASEINNALNGRGGGKGTMVQGKVNVSQKQIEDYIENVCRG